MNKSTESLENIRQVMDDIGLVDGVAFADIVKSGAQSQECRVMLGDFAEGLRALRVQGMICGEIEEALLAEAEETIEFFHSKYCS